MARMQVLVSFIRREVADELDIDLEELHREPGEVREAAEAGAEIVERDGNPEVPQAADESLAGVDVADEGRLRDLHHEPRRVGPVRAEELLDGREKVEVADRARRHVEVDGARPARGQPDGLLDHPEVDFPAQPVLLGDSPGAPGKIISPERAVIRRSSSTRGVPRLSGMIGCE